MMRGRGGSINAGVEPLLVSPLRASNKRQRDTSGAAEPESDSTGLFVNPIRRVYSSIQALRAVARGRPSNIESIL